MFRMLEFWMTRDIGKHIPQNNSNLIFFFKNPWFYLQFENPHLEDPVLTHLENKQLLIDNEHKLLYSCKKAI